MNIFFRRPLALFCSLFAAASLCGCFFTGKTKILCILCALALLTVIALLFIFIKSHRPSIFKLALCVAFIALALALSYLRIDAPTKKVEQYTSAESDITAVITSVNYQSDFASSYQIKLLSVNQDNIATKAILDLEYNAMLAVGDIISLKGEFLKIDDAVDSSRYYKSKGALLYLSAVPETLTLQGKKSGLGIQIYKLNQKLSGLICNNIEGESGNLVSALILGNKDLLSAETERDFRRAGISHVIAISGMHLSVLIFLFDFVLKRLKIGKSLRGGIVIAVAFFYLALTGFSLSTVRAFIMAAMTYLAFVFSEDSDMLTNLFFSLFFILAVSPLSVYDIGLWLSFLALLGIFVAGYFINQFSDKIYAKVKPANKYAKKMSPRVAKLLIALFSSVIITISANVFICVPAWLYFDEISLISVISNLLVSPFISVLLIITPLYIAISKVKILSAIFAFAIKTTCDVLLRLVSFLTSFSGITVSLNYNFTAPIVIFLAVCLSLCLILKFKRQWLIAIPPFVAALMFGICLSLNTQYHSQIMKIEYLGGTESEMLLIRDGNEYSIIDTSSGAYAYSYNAYRKSIENTATEIHSFVLTHYHSRHQNTLYKLFKRAVVQTLYLPYPQDIEEYYQMSALVSIAANAKVNVVLFDANERTMISDNVGLTLSPREYINRSTHPIFYYTLDTPKSKLTYLSESSTDSTEYSSQLNDVLNASQTVILGSHGPKTKNNIDFSNVNGGKTVIITDNNISSHFTANSENGRQIYNNTAHIEISIPKK